MVPAIASSAIFVPEAFKVLCNRISRKVTLPEQVDDHATNSQLSFLRGQFSVTNRIGVRRYAATIVFRVHGATGADAFVDARRVKSSEDHRLGDAKAARYLGRRLAPIDVYSHHAKV